MTTDDLRTRAREAAEGYCGTNTIEIETFIDGALWHAAQQPTHDREVKAEVLREMAEGWMHPDPVSHRFRNWLRDTANRIESQETP